MGVQEVASGLPPGEKTPAQVGSSEPIPACDTKVGGCRGPQEGLAGREPSQEHSGGGGGLSSGRYSFQDRDTQGGSWGERWGMRDLPLGPG